MRSVLVMLTVAALACSSTSLDGSLATEAPPPADVEAAVPLCDAACLAYVRAVQENELARAGNPLGVIAVVDRVFPDDVELEWAVHTIERETGGTWDPDAANPSSSARGLWQLLQSLHGWRYAASTGGVCTADDWADAVCNIHAAAHLFVEEGVRPWRL